MRNVNTQVAASENNPNSLDMAIESPRKSEREGRDIESRVDIVNIDLANNTVTTRLGKQYTLEAKNGGGDVVAERIESLVDHFDEQALARFAMGLSATDFDGAEWASVTQFFGDREDEEREFPEGARAIVRVSPRLVQALGFTPEVAIPA